MEEQWKDINSYKGLYQVSNLGRVKSLDRIVQGKIKDYHYKSKILKPGTNNNGHLFVNLYRDNKPKTRTIHQLVAESFLNHVPCGYKLVIDHIDNDKNNNFLDNLQIITQRLNASKDKKNKSSKYTGVIWHKFHQKWTCSIRIGKSRKYLGYYMDEHKAHLAYQKEFNLIMNNK
jgi:hypothetical protein